MDAFIIYGIPLCIGLLSLVKKYSTYLHSFTYIEKNERLYIPVYINGSYMNIPIQNKQRAQMPIYDNNIDKDDKDAVNFLLRYKLNINNDQQISLLNINKLKEEVIQLSDL